MEKLIDITNRHKGIKGKIFAIAWNRNEINFSTSTRGDNISTLKINGIYYGHDIGITNRTFEMTVKRFTVGWKPYGYSSNMLTQKALEILWELLPIIAAEIEVADPGFLIQAEIESQIEQIKHQEREIVNLQTRIKQAEKEIGAIVQNIGILENELAGITVK